MSPSLSLSSRFTHRWANSLTLILMTGWTPLTWLQLTREENSFCYWGPRRGRNEDKSHPLLCQMPNYNYKQSPPLPAAPFTLVCTKATDGRSKLFKRVKKQQLDKIQKTALSHSDGRKCLDTILMGLWCLSCYTAVAHIDPHVFSCTAAFPWRSKGDVLSRLSLLSHIEGKKNITRKNKGHQYVSVWCSCTWKEQNVHTRG